ncbi:GNAT family N-acetyltransferase [Bradyrhizobium sp. HKCCYLRH3099]|uniref:GNAT family N-acetyltransferase n=1 Tax=unclassified Bradyrhizobium TaxID=2631580 RepID=UPI003EC11E07
MTAADLAAVDRIAAHVHSAYPEEPAVFAERLRLHPAGCRVLVSDTAAITGYVISHPWHLGKPPALNVLIAQLPMPAQTYYIHDLALLPKARGSGAAARIVGDLAAHALELGLPALSLVAVNGSVPFWEQQGFAVDEAAASDDRIASYGDDARSMIRRLT